MAGAVGPHAAAVSGATLFHENRVLGLERMLRVKLQQESPLVPVSALLGAETVSVSAGTNKGIFEMHEVNESELAVTSLVGVDAFANNERVLDDGMKGACSALGVRDWTACAVEGERSGIIGLREVSESESTLHISRFTNSLNSSVGVDMSACARAACALPAAAAPHSRSTVARLPSTRRFRVSNSCHLDTDWTSGNRWAGRRCVEPHGREFGC